MKNLIKILLVLFSTNVFAEMIYVGNDNINAIDTDQLHAANILNNSSNELINGGNCSNDPTSPTRCDFHQTFVNNYYLNDDALKNIVTSDYRTSVKSPNNSNSYIDLSFTDDVINGTGDDLILFFIGNTTSFGLEVFDKEVSPNSLFSDSFTIAEPLSNDGVTISDHGDAVRIPADPIDQWLLVDGYLLSAILIDIGDNSEGTAIGNLHLTLENSNFAFAAGFHTQAAVVPLPLPVILFSSGLALLGWLGHRKKA